MAKLVFRSGAYAGKSFSIPDGKTITMGRNRDIELPLPDLKLSRRHCQITVKDGQCFLKDLGSTNGTFVNGIRVTGDMELNDFDRIILGDTEIEYHGIEQMPLPKNFDSAQRDPFGMSDADDDDEDPLPDSLPMPTGTPSKAQAPVNSLDFDADVLVDSAPPPSAPKSPVPARSPVAAVVGQPAGVLPGPDPLEQALMDLRKPLPPEPMMARTGTKEELRFCDSCSGSIPVLDWELGSAKEVGGQMICKDCLARGVAVPAAPPAPAPSAAKPAAMIGSGARSKSISSILAALDQEAEIVDTSVRRHGGAKLKEDEAAQKINQIQKLSETAAPRPAMPGSVKPSAKPADKDIVKELGDEFEEIG